MLKQIADQLRHAYFGWVMANIDHANPRLECIEGGVVFDIARDKHAGSVLDGCFKITTSAAGHHCNSFDGRRFFTRKSQVTKGKGLAQFFEQGVKR